MSENNIIITAGTTGNNPVVPTTDYTALREFLMNHIAQSTDTSTVDVLPISCGLGKSRFTSEFIADVLRRYSNNGLIVVTDEIARLESYSKPNYDDNVLAEFLSRKDVAERIATLKSDNYVEKLPDLHNKQVICLSTQRFFNLEPDEAEALVTTNKPKQWLLTDEKATLSENIKVDVSLLNDIDDALKQNLDNLVAERDKNWLIDEWQRVRERFYRLFAETEKSHEHGRFSQWYFDPENTNLTTNDARFLELTTKKYRGRLRKGERFHDIVKKIKAVFQVAHIGGELVSCKKATSKSRDEYCNYILVNIDHHDLVCNHSFKSFILDGTSDLDTMYDRWYCNRIDVSKFDRDLSLLTLRLVNVNTSKARLTKGNPEKNEFLKAIREHIAVSTVEPIDAIFSYMAIENQFADLAKATGHLGALKGTNRFRNTTNLFQIGLNRLPDEVYRSMAYDNMRMASSDGYVSLGVPANMLREFTRRGITNPIDAAELDCRNRGIAVDVIQNIFRGAIRNADNDQRMTYTLYYRCQPEVDRNNIDRNELSGLTTLLSEWFRKRGANVVTIDTPRPIKDYKTLNRHSASGDKLASQKILEWLNRLPAGREFKRATIKRECNISDDDFDNAIRYNQHIKARLDAMRIGNGKKYIS